MNKWFKMLNMIGPSQVLFVGKHTVFLESNLYRQSNNIAQCQSYNEKTIKIAIYNFIINYLKAQKAITKKTFQQQYSLLNR